MPRGPNGRVESWYIGEKALFTVDHVVPGSTDWSDPMTTTTGCGAWMLKWLLISARKVDFAPIQKLSRDEVEWKGYQVEAFSGIAGM